MMKGQELSLNNIKKLVKKDLALMDNIINGRLLTKDKLIQDITYHIINSGGKRLRPVLTILSAKLFDHNSNNRHINLAAAVEFIHTATLLHDDVVDHSKLRRGLPTANKHWGNKESILVGDFLLSQAFLLMSEDNDSKVIQILSKAAAVIAEGEVRQLTSIANLNLDIENYFQIISAKTAELFAASCQVGACIATDNTEIRTSMYEFGLNLGMAFQIIDDVLDYVANQNTLGKNIGDDFKEGKVTLPLIIAYLDSGKEEKLFWQRTIHDKKQREEDFAYVLSIFDKYQVIDKCMQIAKEFASKAKKYLDIAPNNDVRDSLITILDFSVSRKF